MSTKSMMQFTEYMVSKSSFLRDYCKDTELYIDPDEPLPVSMLGYFGGRIIDQFDQIAPKEWKLLTGLVEEGMRSDDEDVSMAVATGMIEAMVNVAEEVEGLWPKVEADLGPLSREYANAYRNADDAARAPP